MLILFRLSSCNLSEKFPKKLHNEQFEVQTCFPTKWVCLKTGYECPDIQWLYTTMTHESIMMIFGTIIGYSQLFLPIFRHIEIWRPWQPTETPAISQLSSPSKDPRVRTFSGQAEACCRGSWSYWISPKDIEHVLPNYRGFLKWGYPWLSSVSRWYFPWNKPSSYGCIPIYGNLQIGFYHYF